MKWEAPESKRLNALSILIRRPQIWSERNRGCCSSWLKHAHRHAHCHATCLLWRNPLAVPYSGSQLTPSCYYSWLNSILIKTDHIKKLMWLINWTPAEAPSTAFDGCIVKHFLLRRRALHVKPERAFIFLTHLLSSLYVTFICFNPLQHSPVLVGIVQIN